MIIRGGLVFVWTDLSFVRRQGLCLNTLYVQPFYSECSGSPGKISLWGRQMERFSLSRRVCGVLLCFFLCGCVCFVVKLERGEKETMRQKHLNSIEQALQEVVSSKQCIWKSWLLAVEFSGHIFDLQPWSTAVLTKANRGGFHCDACKAQRWK